MTTATMTVKNHMMTGGSLTMTAVTLTPMTEGTRIMMIGGIPTLMSGMMTGESSRMMTDESPRMMIDTMIGGLGITTSRTALEVKSEY